jgi:hypothetical protein
LRKVLINLDLFMAYHQHSWAFDGSVANGVENDEAAGYSRGCASSMRSCHVGCTSLFDKEGLWEIFILLIEGAVRTWTSFKALLTIDSVAIDHGGLTPPKLRLIFLGVYFPIHFKSGNMLRIRK